MKILLSHLSAKNLPAIAEQVVSASKILGKEEIVSHPLFVRLEAASADYQVMCDKSKHSNRCSLVAEADLRRHEPYAALKSILLGYAKIGGFSLQKEAKDLYRIFELQTFTIERFSYLEHTIYLKTLINNLEKPINVNKIEQLQLTEIMMQLKIAQLDFERICKMSKMIPIMIFEQESATSLKGNLNHSLKNFLNIVAAMKQNHGWNRLYTELESDLKSKKPIQQLAKKQTIKKAFITLPLRYAGMQ